uniref:Uncharacterized protein n=1 Tax=Arundo donax TaxID=35708 RepID=A0A0A9BP20_ARUDO
MGHLPHHLTTKTSPCLTYKSEAKATKQVGTKTKWLLLSVLASSFTFFLETYWSSSRIPS